MAMAAIAIIFILEDSIILNNDGTHVSKSIERMGMLELSQVEVAAFHFYNVMDIFIF